MDYIECICGGLNQECNRCGGRGFLPTHEKAPSGSITDQDVRKNIFKKLIATAAKIPQVAQNNVTNGASIASFYFNCTNQELEELHKKIKEVYYSLRYYRLCHRLLNENPRLVSKNAWHMKLLNINFNEQSSIEKAKKYSEIIKRQIQQYGTIEIQNNANEINPVVLDHKYKFNKYWHQLFPGLEFSFSFLKTNTTSEAAIFFKLFNAKVKEIKNNLLVEMPILGKKKLKIDLDIIRKKLITVFLNKYLTQETVDMLNRKYKQLTPNRR